MSRYEAARHTDAHEFDLIVTTRATPEQLGALTAAGADDYLTGPEDNDHTRLCFTRAAPTLAEALVTAIQDVQGAGLDVEDVRCFGMTGPDMTAIYPDLQVDA